MTTYFWLNAAFLGLVIVFWIAAMAIHGRRARRHLLTSDTAPTPQPGRRLGALGITLVVLLILTAIFDNVIVGLGIVDYDTAKILGVLIGVAPLEDFAYAIAAVLVLPALWTLLGSRATR